MSRSALSLASDRLDLGAYSTLPKYVRFKSQSLCKYLTVSEDGKGRLTFSGKMNQVDPNMVFETVHVHAPDKPQPNGRQVVKIKSLATGKFWKRIANSKVPECKVPKDAKEGVWGGGLYNVVMAIASSEADADVFEYETQGTSEGGAESKMVTLWSPVNKRYLAPVNVIQSFVTHKSIDFVGCVSKEKSWKESILVAEWVAGPGKTIWPMGISSENALASFILSAPVDVSPIDDAPKTIHIEEAPSTEQPHIPRKFSVQALDVTQSQAKEDESLTADTPSKGMGRGVKDLRNKNPSKSDPKKVQSADASNELKSFEHRNLENLITANHTSSEASDLSLRFDAISVLAKDARPMVIPRKLTEEEMAVVFSDSPDLGSAIDPGVTEDVAGMQSRLINLVNTDWAKDWTYSLTGICNDPIPPNPPPPASSLKGNTPPTHTKRSKSVMALDVIIQDPQRPLQPKPTQAISSPNRETIHTHHTDPTTTTFKRQEGDLGVHGSQIYTISSGRGLFYDHVGNKAREPRPSISFCPGERLPDPLEKPHLHCAMPVKKRPVILTEGTGRLSSWTWSPDPVKEDRAFIEKVYAARREKALKVKEAEKADGENEAPLELTREQKSSKASGKRSKRKK